MKDAKGQPIEVGDTVIVPCRVVDVQGMNLGIEAIGSVPAGEMSSDGTIDMHPSQVVRSNDGDDTSFRIVRDGDKTLIRRLVRP